MLRNLTGTHVNYVSIYGNYISETDPAFRLILAESDNKYYGYPNTVASRAATINNKSINTKHFVIHNNSGISFDGMTPCVSNSGPSYTNTETLFLWHTRNATGDNFQNYRLRFYNFEIYDGNTLLLKFIPCVRKNDNKPGMYDIISNTFFTNIGMDDFTIPT